MAVIIKCQKCGHENRLGQLFCRECGTKLDLSNLTPEVVARNNRSDRGGSLIGRLARLVVTLSLLAILGLLCWPLPPAGDAPSAVGASIVQGKMAGLRGAIMRKNEVRETFVEADINAHLNATLTSADKASGLQLILQDIRLDLHNGEAQVWTKSTLGPVPITYSLITRFSRESDGRYIFNADDVKIGHLPMPGPLRAKVVNQLVAMFRLLQDEMMLLQRLGSVETADGAIHVSTTAP